MFHEFIYEFGCTKVPDAQPHPARPSTRPGPDGPARPVSGATPARHATPTTPHPAPPTTRPVPYPARPKTAMPPEPNDGYPLSIQSRRGAASLRTPPSRWRSDGPYPHTHARAADHAPAAAGRAGRERRHETRSRRGGPRQPRAAAAVAIAAISGSSCNSRNKRLIASGGMGASPRDFDAPPTRPLSR